MKRIPWFRKRKKTAPEIPLRAPLPVGPLSNGEFFHPDNERKQLIRRLVFEHAEVMARKHNVDRREFLASAAGMASTLAAINFVNACSSGGGSMGSSGGSPKIKSSGGSGQGGSSGGGSTGTGNGSGAGKSGGAGSGSPIDAGASMGPFKMDASAVQDPDAAECAIGPLMGTGKDLIIDMQSHFVNDQSAYLTNPLIGSAFNGWLANIKNQLNQPGAVIMPDWGSSCTGNACYNRDNYVQMFFMDSDTTVGVLSGIPYVACAGQTGVANCDFAPLTDEEIRDAKKYLNDMVPGRVLSHAMVMPNDRLQAQLMMMEKIAADYDINNWKCYPVWAPNMNGGYWMDDEMIGIPMIQKGIELGINIFCTHKGFPLPGFSRTYSDPKDMGVVATRFNRNSEEGHAIFVVYHSAFEHGIPGTSGQGTPDIEGPYDPDDKWEPDMAGAPPNSMKYPVTQGVSSLIKSALDNGIKPNDPDNHLYAELGGVWPSLAGGGRMTEAAHVLGKLLQYIGEDRVVWGTDCLWFGTPRPFIEAFRAFDIPQEMQDKYGYPALTPERKAKILGYNAARLQGISCNVSDYPALPMKAQLDGEWGQRRYMMAPTPGPRTHRQFMDLVREEHHEKLRWSGYGTFKRG